MNQGTGLRALSAAAVTLLAACNSGPGQRTLEMQKALESAHVSLADSVVVAQGDGDNGHAIRASLMTGAQPMFSIATLASEQLQDVRVDPVSGGILSKNAISGTPALCGDSLGLDQAIAIAENEVGGSAVSVQPDDDDACDREVQVLSGDTLWEVKIAPDGTVKEKEVSDDDGE